MPRWAMRVGEEDEPRQIDKVGDMVRVAIVGVLHEIHKGQHCIKDCDEAGC